VGPPTIQATRGLGPGGRKVKFPLPGVSLGPRPRACVENPPMNGKRDGATIYLRILGSARKIGATREIFPNACLAGKREKAPPREKPLLGPLLPPKALIALIPIIPKDVTSSNRCSTIRLRGKLSPRAGEEYYKVQR
jgi:hypothetical protein